jgi:hypothetical protein
MMLANVLLMRLVMIRVRTLMRTLTVVRMLVKRGLMTFVMLG